MTSRDVQGSNNNLYICLGLLHSLYHLIMATALVYVGSEEQDRDVIIPISHVRDRTQHECFIGNHIA